MQESIGRICLPVLYDVDPSVLRKMEVLENSLPNWNRFGRYSKRWKGALLGSEFIMLGYSQQCQCVKLQSEGKRLITNL